MAKLRAQKFRNLDDFIRSHISSVTKRRELIAATLAEKRKSLAALDQSARTLRDIERQRDLIEHDYKAYANKAEDFRISTALNKQHLTSVKILGPALPPEKPAKPWVTVVMVLAAFLGMFLGFAYATVSEYFDHSLCDKEDVESALGVPLLAIVPDAKYSTRAATRPARV
jgi:succinoglycan biosynthesis transport protein ExoP